MQKHGFSIDGIGDVALSVGIAIIVVAVVALILATFIPSTYTDITVTNTTFDNSTTIPVGYELKSWSVFNDTTQVYGALPANNYTLYANNGSLTIDDTEAIKYGDESVNFVYSGNSNATAVVSKGLIAISAFADWFSIIIIVVVAVVILTLVMLLRGRGGRE